MGGVCVYNCHCTCVQVLLQVNVADVVESSEASKLLRGNTDDALKHGAFGVPR